MAGFKEAFASARKKLGAGKTFQWNGKSYSTNYARESKVNPQISDMAGKGNDKPGSAPKTSPRPKTRNSNKPTVDSTAPSQPAAPKPAANVKVVTKRSVSAKAGAGANTGGSKSAGGRINAAKKPSAMESKNVGALKSAASKVVSNVKEVLSKGSVTGSAYDLRHKAAARKRRGK